MLDNRAINEAMTIKLGNEYPDYPEFQEGIRRAPDRGFRLTKEQTKIALKNALRYVPEELHEKLAPEFMEELTTRGRIYAYRYRPDEIITGKPISEYKGKCLAGKAFQVMIDNNLDFEVALYPYELVTYGETGQVCQNWLQYRLIKKYLEEMTEYQTLVVESGHPLGLFPSKPEAPRVIITNSMMIGMYNNLEDWEIAEEMGVRGLMNMQYAIEDGKVYVLEANPRASRTVPLVSKVCNIRMVPLATDIITSELTGRPSPITNLKEQDIPYYGVKEAVFPFNMFQEVDPILGPEMRSTGEVLGLSASYGEAYYKAQEATQSKLPLGGTVLFSVNDRDKAEVVEIARSFNEAGFHIIATGRTCDLITDAGIPAKKVKKLSEGRPCILDIINNGEVNLIVNTPAGKDALSDDSYLRKAAIKAKVPYMTTMAAAKATADGLLYMKSHPESEVKSIQELHAEIKDK